MSKPLTIKKHIMYSSVAVGIYFILGLIGAYLLADFFNLGPLVPVLPGERISAGLLAGRGSLRRIIGMLLIHSVAAPGPMFLLYRIGEPGRSFVPMTKDAWPAACTKNSEARGLSTGQTLTPKADNSRLVLRLRLVCIFFGGLFFYIMFGILAVNTPFFQLTVCAAFLLVGNILMSVLNREILMYLIFGLLTTVVSIGSFSIMNLVLAAGFHVEPQEGLLWLIPQTVSFFAAVLFGFVTNRKYVFCSTGPWRKELIGFIGNRLLSSLILEYGGLYLLVTVLSMNSDLAKMISAFSVVVVNYFISKLLIFKKTAAT